MNPQPVTQKVLLIHTGGTLGMWENKDGVYEPKRGYLQTLLNAMPELNPPQAPLPEFDLVELDPLLDSAAMTPKHWKEIADYIYLNHDYDGFVIIHGTDTMSYTASALSFWLQDLDRPVMMTGSQIPLQEQRNDAREHLLTAMILAATSGIQEVCLYFHGKILRGNRTTKSDADGYDAFTSPNYPPLGEVGVRIHINPDLGEPATSQTTRSPMTLSSLDKDSFPVGVFRIYPGVDPNPLERMIPDGPLGFGLVLETFGAGNAPQSRLQPVLKQAIDSGVVVVNLTQCLKGTVNPALYAAGSWLQAIGVTSGIDMTPEAAVTKLFYLLSQFPLRQDADEVRRRMGVNLRGELTGEWFVED